MMASIRVQLLEPGPPLDPVPDLLGFGFLPPDQFQPRLLLPLRIA
jgi:hypothetical protein